MENRDELWEAILKSDLIIDKLEQKINEKKVEKELLINKSEKLDEELMEALDREEAGEDCWDEKMMKTLSDVLEEKIESIEEEIEDLDEEIANLYEDINAIRRGIHEARFDRFKNI